MRILKHKKCSSITMGNETRRIELGIDKHDGDDLSEFETASSEFRRRR